MSYLERMQRALGSQTPSLEVSLSLDSLPNVRDFCAGVGGGAEACLAHQNSRIQLCFEYMLEGFAARGLSEEVATAFEKRFKSSPNPENLKGIHGELSAALTWLALMPSSKLHFLPELKTKEVDFLTESTGGQAFHEVKALQDNFGWPSTGGEPGELGPTLVRPLSTREDIYDAAKRQHAGDCPVEVDVRPSAAYSLWRKLERDAMPKFQQGGRTNVLWLDNNCSTRPDIVSAALCEHVEQLSAEECKGCFQGDFLTRSLSGIVTFNVWEPGQIIHFWANPYALNQIDEVFQQRATLEAQRYREDVEDRLRAHLAEENASRQRMWRAGFG